MRISRDSHLAMARQMCADDKLAGAQFWSFISADRELVPVLLPIGPETNRVVNLVLLQIIAKRLGAVRAIMVTEVWMAMYDRHAGETEAEHHARSTQIEPRKSAHRREAIHLLDVRKGKPPVTLTQAIERDEHGRPLFPKKPDKMPADGMSGPWLHVLEEPPSLPPGPLGDRMRAAIDAAITEITLNDAGEPT